MATVQQVLDIARSQLGYVESPARSNNTKYGAWFGMNGVPWCEIFKQWCADQAGLQPITRTASVYVKMAAYQAAGRFFTTDPRPGDEVFWSFGEGHTEWLERVPLTGRTLVCIGGNTSSGNGSPDNGGEVARRTRAWNSQCLGFGRPAYSVMPDPPAPATQEDDMADPRCVEYPTGAKTKVDAQGDIFNAGTPYFGSLSELPADKRQGVTSIEMLTKADPNDPNAGYKMWAQNGNGYLFNAELWKSLGH